MLQFGHNLLNANRKQLDSRLLATPVCVMASSVQLFPFFFLKVATAAYILACTQWVSLITQQPPGGAFQFDASIHLACTLHSMKHHTSNMRRPKFLVKDFLFPLLGSLNAPFFCKGTKSSVNVFCATRTKYRKVFDSFSI